MLARVSLQVADIAAAEQSPILHLPRSIGYYAIMAAAVLTAVTSLTIAIRVALLGADAAPRGSEEESVI